MAWVTPSNVATGDVLTASTWNQDVVENTTALRESIIRLDFTTSTSAATSNTTIGTASDVFSSDASWTADGTSAYVVEGYIPLVETAATIGVFCDVYLVTGAGASIGIAARITRPHTALAASGSPFFRVFYTPSAGSASVNLRLVASATSTAYGTLGLPMHLAVYGPVTS